MLFDIPILAVPPALVALAIVLDRWSRRGYGLGVLAALALALDIWGISIVSQALEQARASHPFNMSLGFMAVIYELIGLYLTLVLLLGGIVETIIARQRRWLALIVLVTLVLLVMTFGPTTQRVPNVLAALGLSPDGEAAVLVLVPVLVILAYALTRIFQPVAPRGALAPRSSAR